MNAETAAKEQQARAEDRETLAIDAVKRFGDVVRVTRELKDEPSLAGLRATLLKEPQTFFKRLRERLQADRETTPGSLARLAAASFELGHFTNEIGDKQDALRAFEESLAICERLRAAITPRAPSSSGPSPLVTTTSASSSMRRATRQRRSRHTSRHAQPLIGWRKRIRRSSVSRANWP